MAGCEAAWQLLSRGVGVTMYEMRPASMTGAHTSGGLAELVCSNSLKSLDISTPAGLLKAELEALGSFLIRTAKRTAVPAGSALAVDRANFSAAVEAELTAFPHFKLVRKEVKQLPKNTVTIIATGPLSSASITGACLQAVSSDITGPFPRSACAVSSDIALLCGGETSQAEHRKLTSPLSMPGLNTRPNNLPQDLLFFYDATAPIIDAESIDMNIAFFASRYGKGNPQDYLNLPMNREQYDVFYNALISAERVVLKDFEKVGIYEGCMPIEILAARGKDAIRYGPLKPVGLGNGHYAVVQLRKENMAGSAYNMVGFQTNLKFGEQQRVFSLIPGLKHAEFLRYGTMHRNTYLNTPRLKPSLGIYFAGQITGVEGYVESIMSGLITALNVIGKKPPPPPTAMCGALINYINTPSGKFKPMGANFGLLPPLADAQKIKDKNSRKIAMAERALRDIIEWRSQNEY